jgi:hypothetical protein
MYPGGLTLYNCQSVHFFAWSGHELCDLIAIVVSNLIRILAVIPISYDVQPNTFRGGVLACQYLIGCWCSLANPVTTEILGLAGFDWLLLDAEHSPNDVLTLIPRCRFLSATTSHSTETKISLLLKWVIYPAMVFQHYRRSLHRYTEGRCQISGDSVPSPQITRALSKQRAAGG